MDKEQKNEIVKACGALVAAVLIVILGQLFVSCSPRILPPAEVRDSVRVEVRERVVHDTAYVEIPVVKEVNVTRDSSSHLENDYATSDASIADGMLHHSLETKPQKLAAPITVTVHDTTYVEKHGEVIVEEVPAQFTKWQSFQMILGRILGIVLLLCVAFTAYKVIVKYK